MNEIFFSFILYEVFNILNFTAKYGDYTIPGYYSGSSKRCFLSDIIAGNDF